MLQRVDQCSVRNLLNPIINCFTYLVPQEAWQWFLVSQIYSSLFFKFFCIWDSAHFTKCLRSRQYDMWFDAKQQNGSWRLGGWECYSVCDRDPERQAGTGLRRLAWWGRSRAPVNQGLSFKGVKRKKQTQKRRKQQRKKKTKHKNQPSRWSYWWDLFLDGRGQIWYRDLR